jgi:pimeloyl-ACP methyl ester carboxylesterase
VQAPFDRFRVSVGNGSCDIWTLSTNTKSTNVPLVMIHGFAAGIAFWVLNLDDAAANRPVYAFDLPGFARSSRPNFSSDALEIESQFVDYIEEWRQAVGLEKMILLGHSFGGFLSSSYALKYPERVEHLILADPWGFTGRPDLSNVGFFRKSMLKLFQNMKPLSIMRAAGPYG